MDVSDAGIPITYVPARNTIFLSFALAWAETLGSSRYLHRGERARLQRLSRLPPGIHRGLRADGESRDKGGSRRRAEAHDSYAADPMTKAEIIRVGFPLGVDYSLTSSCYDPSPEGRPCGECDSCQLRRKGFAEAAHLTLCYRACNTSSAWPAGLTLWKIFAIFPLVSIRNVVRSMPKYFFPYMLFSFQTPYASATVWSTSASSG